MNESMVGRSKKVGLRTSRDGIEANENHSQQKGEIKTQRKRKQNERNYRRKKEGSRNTYLS